MASQQVLTLPRGADTAACNGLTLPADPLHMPQVIILEMMY